MMGAMLALIKRDALLSFGRDAQAFLPVTFMMCVTAMLPFALGPDLSLLARIGAPYLWIVVLLANFLSLDQFFRRDDECGVLDVLMFGSLPLEGVVLAKILSHWLFTGLLTALCAPLMGVTFNLEPQALLGLMLTLSLGTLALSALSALAAAMTLALRNGGLLAVLLVMPFAVPVLIFGVSAQDHWLQQGVLFAAPLKILLAVMLVSVTLALFAVPYVLRAGREG